ncbi:MAG: hypothetical protein OEZ14_00640 [Acidimicrobiia bacterium]|nr:hypothetical protein [Acidimicrobiia bacterium]
MTDIQNLTFQSLLAAWRTHEELHRSGASIAELSAARFKLDEAREVASMAIR